MTPEQLVKAIKHLKPTADFSFKEADYSTIKWHKINGAIPTLLEIENALIEVEKNEAQAAVEAANKKQALLNKLGITEDEAKLLLS
jgi:hypothetical protein